MVLGFTLAIYRCRKTGINKEHIYNLALWLIPVCIICARAYYVIFEWDNYKNDLLSVFEINRGGLAIYGGVLGGVAVALIYCKVKRISLRCLHRRNRPMAAGNLFLRICIEFSFTHRYADMLPAFQAKRLSPSGYPCITGAVRLPDYSRYRYTFYYP